LTFKESLTKIDTMKEAMFYKRENDKVECYLCAHNCIINNNNRGICKVRINKNGKLFSLVYNKAIAENIDPVEKKPLYHFLPGTYTYSLATVGCNFKCLNCQNYEISQFPELNNGYIYGKELTPEEIINKVKSNHLPSISFTYTEPTVYYEYAKDIGIFAKTNGIKNIFVSNGYMSKECADDLKNWLHGINIDLKSFSDDFYKKICKARLKPVLDNIERLKANGIWVEITTLIIPELNSSEKELKNIAKFIKSVDKNIPWHVSAFYPTFKLTNSYPTPPELVIKAREIGLEEGLNYVYTGNIRDYTGQNTYCPECNEILIKRAGYFTEILNLNNDKCSNCGFEIAGIFE